VTLLCLVILTGQFALDSPCWPCWSVARHHGVDVLGHPQVFGIMSGRLACIYVGEPDRPDLGFDGDGVAFVTDMAAERMPVFLRPLNQEPHVVDGNGKAGCWQHLPVEIGS